MNTNNVNTLVRRRDRYQLVRDAWFMMCMYIGLAMALVFFYKYFTGVLDRPELAFLMLLAPIIIGFVPAYFLEEAEIKIDKELKNIEAQKRQQAEQARKQREIKQRQKRQQAERSRKRREQNKMEQQRKAQQELEAERKRKVEQGLVLFTVLSIDYNRGELIEIEDYYPVNEISSLAAQNQATIAMYQAEVQKAIANEMMMQMQWDASAARVHSEMDARMAETTRRNEQMRAEAEAARRYANEICARILRDWANSPLRGNISTD